MASTPRQSASEPPAGPGPALGAAGTPGPGPGQNPGLTGAGALAPTGAETNPIVVEESPERGAAAGAASRSPIVVDDSPERGGAGAAAAANAAILVESSPEASPAAARGLRRGRSLSPPSSPESSPGSRAGEDSEAGPGPSADVSAEAAPAAPGPAGDAPSPEASQPRKRPATGHGILPRPAEGEARPVYYARQQLVVDAAAVGEMPPIAFRGYVDAIPTVDYGAQPAPSGPKVVVHQPAKLSREDRARLQDESTEFLRSDVVSLLVQLLKADAAAAPGCDDTAVVLTSYESNNIEDLIKGGVSDRAIALNAASEKEWGRATRLVLPVNRGNLHWYCMSVPIDPADAGDIIVYDSLIRAGQSPPAQDAEYARWCTYARAFVCAMNVRYGTRHAVPERYSVCRGPLQTDGYTCGLMAFFAMRYFVMAKPMPKLPADDRAAGPTLKRIARVELGRIEKKRPQPPQEAIRALVLAGKGIWAPKSRLVVVHESILGSMAGAFVDVSQS